MKLRKISVIIPCFNEQDYIGLTLMRVVRVDLGAIKKEIIVVDDGSNDASSRIVEKKIKQFPNISLLRHIKNRGKGASIKTGLKKATGDVVIIQDADSEYDPGQYSELIKPFVKENAKIVYGSRTLGIGAYGNRYSSLHFYFGGRLLTHIINSLFRTKITDQPTGYKLFTKSLVPLLLKTIKEDGFAAEVEITAICAQAGIPIVEIPIRYTPRTIAQGKKIRLTDFIQSLIVAVKYKMRFYGDKRI